MRHFLYGSLLATSLLSTPALADRAANEPIDPIEPYESDEPAKVELGKMLFFEPRLSKSGFISCNSCHNLARGGGDNLPSSIGHNWQEGPIKSPTVLNASLAFAQFWDGRAEDLQEQAAGPIENPIEMAFTHELAVNVLTSIPEYRERFKAIYGSEDFTMTEVTDAIAEFERTLVTPNAPFDQWLQGDDDAISEQELAGYRKFKEVGCTACHYGEAVGGQDFQRMGLIEEYDTDNPSQGRFEVTGDDSDRFLFKTPTLRNVELNYPYFHDGAYWDLGEAVRLMGRIQLARELTDEEVADITAFLQTLTGDRPDIQIPHLPPSTGDTPRPRPFEGYDAEGPEGTE